MDPAEHQILRSKAAGHPGKTVRLIPPGPLPAGWAVPLPVGPLPAARPFGSVPKACLIDADGSLRPVTKAAALGLGAVPLANRWRVEHELRVEAAHPPSMRRLVAVPKRALAVRDEERRRLRSWQEEHAALELSKPPSLFERLLCTEELEKEEHEERLLLEKWWLRRFEDMEQETEERGVERAAAE